MTCNHISQGKPRLTIPDLIDGRVAELTCAVSYGGPRVDDTSVGQLPHLSIEVDGQPLDVQEERIEGIPGPDYKEHSVQIVSYIYYTFICEYYSFL